MASKPEVDEVVKKLRGVVYDLETLAVKLASKGRPGHVDHVSKDDAALMCLDDVSRIKDAIFILE